MMCLAPGKAKPYVHFHGFPAEPAGRSPPSPEVEGFQHYFELENLEGAASQDPAGVSESRFGTGIGSLVPPRMDADRACDLIRGRPKTEQEADRLFQFGSFHHQRAPL